MRSIINILVGFLYSLAPISLAAVLSLFIYNELPNYIGIIIISILGVFSIWLGIKIFNKIQVVGPIEFISAVSASPDMDNLEPTANSSTKRRHPKELVDLIKQKNNLLKGGSFRIFGDWYGKPYDNLHIIKNANFDSNESKLTIEFEGQEILEIFNPKHIFENIHNSKTSKHIFENFQKSKNPKNMFGT